MEGNSLVIPLNFRVKGKYFPNSSMECKVIIRALMGNYQGITVEYINTNVINKLVV